MGTKKPGLDRTFERLFGDSYQLYRELAILHLYKIGLPLLSQFFSLLTDFRYKPMQPYMFL